MTIHRTRRDLRIDCPIGQDRTFVILVEYHWEEDDGGNVIQDSGWQQVLTVNGWVEFKPWECWSLDGESGPPFISGTDLAHFKNAREAILKSLKDALTPTIYRDLPSMQFPEPQPEPPVTETNNQERQDSNG